MTLTNVLPDSVATDVLSRRLPDISDGSGGGDQGRAFPEMLGRLAVLQTAEQRASLPAIAAGDGPALATEPQPSLPWQLRVNDGLVLHSRGIVAGAQAQTSDPLDQVLAQEGKPVELEVPDDIASLAQELLAAEHPGGESKPEGVEGAGIATGDEKAQATNVPTTAAVPAQSGAQPTAMVAGSEAVLMLPDAKLSTKATSGRSAEASRDPAAAIRAKSEIAGPAARIPTGDQSERLPQSAMDVDLSGEPPRGHTGEPETAPFAGQETKVTVLRTETHLPPTGPALLMQQIGEHIEAALSDVSEADGNPAIDTSRGPTPAAPVKVLHIQLQPLELGTVTVRMTLKRDGLEVQIDVARQETAQLLRRDHEAISKALQSAGYALDGVTVQVVEADRSTSAQFGGQSQHGNAQSSMYSQTDWSRSDGQSSDTQRQAGQESRRQPGKPEPGPGTLNSAGGPRATSGGVYL